VFFFGIHVGIIGLGELVHWALMVEFTFHVIFLVSGDCAVEWELTHREEIMESGGWMYDMDQKVSCTSSSLSHHILIPILTKGF
jgi:hypothetical protein